MPPISMIVPNSNFLERRDATSSDYEISMHDAPLIEAQNFNCRVYKLHVVTHQYLAL